MKILIAKTAGFCMGVHRAVDMAVHETSRVGQHPIYSLGPLIHNAQTLEMLKNRGLEMINEKELPAPGSRILIRAHGIPPSTREKYTSTGSYSILDGTCPKVKTVHRVIQRYRDLGYSIVIAGDPGHAEVIGLQGYAQEAGYLIRTPEEASSLPLLKKICLVSQTTFNRETFDAIADKLREHLPNSEIVVKKTICSATDKRQIETRDLAKRVDALIVVGGTNSANTIRLADIAKSCGTRTWHIETETELDWKELSHYQTIGVTAGASTPHWMIKRVVEHLHHLDMVGRRTTINKILYSVERLANINIFVALGGVALYYVSCVFQDVGFMASGALVSLLYLFSIYLWNSLACLESNRHLDMSRYIFYRANKEKLTILTFGCISLLLLVSIIQTMTLFWLMLVATVAGTIYHITIFPARLNTIIPYKNLKDIPTSRDLFAALAWAVLITFIPQAVHGIFSLKPITGVIFIWTFLLVYLRSLIFDMRDIEGDRIMGRETLITIIGEKKARRFIALTIVVLTGLLTAVCLPNLIGGWHFLSRRHALIALSQVPVLAYTWVFMKKQRAVETRIPQLFNLFADGQFYLAGFCAWLFTVRFSG